MNDKTNLENNAFVDEKTAIAGGKEKKNSKEWVGVTLGGFGGILMGSGLMFAADTFANKPENPTPETDPVGGGTENLSVAGTADTAHIAHVDPSMSFGEAFAAARAQVGPGGVFTWHGGVYNTYTTEEWNTMTPQQHSEFISHVPVQVSASKLNHQPTDAHPDIAQHQASGAISGHPHGGGDTVANPGGDNDGGVEIPEDIQEGFGLGTDVHIVGMGTEDGHLVVGYDSSDDGEGDFVIIDVDDNHYISENDVFMDAHGNVATISEVVEHTDEGLAYNPPVYDGDGDGKDGIDAGYDDYVEETVDDSTSDDGYLSYTSNDYDSDSGMSDFIDDAVMDA
jgi:hypothetical protein